jgi:FtsX-like permease family
VALGVGLLLVSLAGINAVNAQNARYAWLESGAVAKPGPVATPAGRSAPNSLWWLLSGDYFGGRTIGRVDVAATGPSSPIPPGIPRLPGPGEYYASPALSRLLRTTPADQLAGRFPGRQVGTIGPAALPAPDSLLIIIGHTAGQPSHIPGATRVSRISTMPPSGCTGSACVFGIGINANGIDLTLAVVACGLLLPVLIFIGTATRLSSARREQRFAAMRLVGATPRQISAISAVESSVAAAAGVAVGFGLFFLLRRPLAAIPFTGAPFFPSDLSLNLPDILLAAAGVPVAAAVVARLALRRVQISPLGVSRRVTPRPPRAYRVIPLLAGLAELAYFVVAGNPETTRGQVEAYLPGFVLIMAGLVIAGPWLTMTGSRVMARRTSRPAILIAARRLADDPKAGFRAVSGLVLALFVTSVAVGVITTFVTRRDAPFGGTAARGILMEQFIYGPRPISVIAVKSSTLNRLRSVAGVEAAAVIHSDPLGITIPAGEVGMPRSFGSLPTGLISCAQLARMPELGRCPAGARAAALPAGGLPAPDSGAAPAAWPAADISAQRLQHVGIQSIAVRTNGSAAALERTRTALEAAYPYLGPPATIGEFRARDMRLTLDYERLADVMILTSLTIAGCTLAVSVAAGLTDRKRPFSMLRLTGAPLAMLGRVVTLESAAPLLTVAVVSIAVGFLAASLFLRSQLDYSLQPPGAEYYALVLAGLLVCVGIIASTVPLLKRITGPETARNE